MNHEQQASVLCGSDDRIARFVFRARIDELNKGIKKDSGRFLEDDAVFLRFAEAFSKFQTKLIPLRSYRSSMDMR